MAEMFNSIPASMFTIYSGMVLLAASCCLLGSSAYEIAELKKQKNAKLHPYAKAQRVRPLISIIVTTYNNAATIEACLRSILRSSYRNFEVIVIDDFSKDSTKKIVTAFIKEHPKAAIRLIAKRKQNGLFETIKSNYVHRINGSYTLILSPTSCLEIDTLKSARAQIISTKADVVILNSCPMTTSTVAGLYQQLANSLHCSALKFMDILGFGKPVQLTNTLFSREVFIALFRNKADSKPYRIRFASDVIIQASAPKSFRRLFWLFIFNCQNIAASKQTTFNQTIKRKAVEVLAVTFGRMTFLLIPIYTSYLLYLAISFKQPTLFGLSWAIFSFILLLIINSDTSLSFKTKIQRTTIIPIAYSLFYLVATLQLIGLMSWPFMKLLRDHHIYRDQDFSKTI